MEDEKIVQLFFHRDETALQHTADKYGSRLRSVSFGITSDELIAEECENDTYLEAWNRIPPNNPASYFYAFLARIVRHISIDRYRELKSLKRNAKIVELTDELASCIPASDSIDSKIDAKMLGEAISRFLLTLSDEKQLIFMRRYFYLDSIAEISSRLSVSESKVKTSLFRIRNSLRNYLIKDGYTL